MNRGLFIEPIPCEEESVVFATEAERITAALCGDRRRREFFAWRALVRRELGPVAVGYNGVGAPILPEHPEIHLAVSHGAGRVAVCISDGPCAVDIEDAGRAFDTVASRFLTTEERTLSDDPRLPAVVWCAKECLYKLSGKTELDLLSDLRVTALGPDWVEGNIEKGKTVRFSLCYVDGAVVVWSL